MILTTVTLLLITLVILMTISPLRIMSAGNMIAQVGQDQVEFGTGAESVIRRAAYCLRGIFVPYLLRLMHSLAQFEEMGYKVTVLPPRRARASELTMSMTKGSRTNTNRRGQAYSGHAIRPETSVIGGSAGSYFKTSG